MSVTAVYDKLNRIEPQISEALLRYSYAHVFEVAAFFEATCSITSGIPDKRLLMAIICRQRNTARLPCARSRLRHYQAKVLLFLTPIGMAICDVFLEEDGHAQERRQIPSVLERVEAGELWIADRHYSTQQMFFELPERGALSLIRQHGS